MLPTGWLFAVICRWAEHTDVHPTFVSTMKRKRFLSPVRIWSLFLSILGQLVCLTGGSGPQAAAVNSVAAKGPEALPT